MKSLPMHLRFKGRLNACKGGRDCTRFTHSPTGSPLQRNFSGCPPWPCPPTPTNKTTLPQARCFIRYTQMGFQVLDWLVCLQFSVDCPSPLKGKLQEVSLTHSCCPVNICWSLWTNAISSVAQSCPTLCDPMNCRMPGLPVQHQLPEFTQTHAHRVGDVIQPSPPLSSPSPPAPNPSQHQGLFQWVSSSNEVAKVLEFQL